MNRYSVKAKVTGMTCEVNLSRLTPPEKVTNVQNIALCQYNNKSIEAISRN